MLKCFINIKGAMLARAETTKVKYSKLTLTVLTYLKNEGLIKTFKLEYKYIRIWLNPEATILYSLDFKQKKIKYREVKFRYYQSSFFLLSTDIGILNLNEALKFKKGGLLLLGS